MGASGVRLPATSVIDEMEPGSAVDALRTLFEDAPRFLARLVSHRPFVDDDGLIAAARATTLEAPEAERIELLNAHPPIGASRGMSAMSRAEQSAGVDADPGSLAARLADLNGRYEKRFGFRFVVFVAGRPRTEIVPLMEAALAGERDAELRRGAADAVAIAADRLAKLRAADAPRPTIGA